AQRARRREPRLVDHVHLPAAHLRLLPGRGAARLAADDRLDAAADLCVRGHAGAGDRPRLPPGPDARIARAQRAVLRGRFVGVPGAVEKRAPQRSAHAGWRITGTTWRESDFPL